MHWLAFAVVALAAAVVAGGVRFALGTVNGVTMPLALMSIGDGYYLTPVAAGAFLAMRQAALADGVAFVVNSAFRSSEAQVKIWRERTDDPGTPLDYSDDKRNAKWDSDGPVARPGTSKHEAGTAVDIDTAGGTNAAFVWLTANAGRFGFKRTVAKEPWHWEYAP